MKTEELLNKKRDISLDIVKGLAISLVITGHVLQACYKDASNFILFNIIWAVQIPIFMTVSGFLATGHSNINSVAELKSRLFKALQGYLLPFITFYFIIKVLILQLYGNFGEATLYLMTHIDSSLWYLFVCFVLNIITCVSVFVSNKSKKSYNKILTFCFSFAILILPWAVLCFCGNSKFLGAKYIVYYSLFYGGAYLVQMLKSENIFNKLTLKVKNNLSSLLGFISGIAFFIMVLKFNLYESPNTILGVLP